MHFIKMLISQMELLYGFLKKERKWVAQRLENRIYINYFIIMIFFATSFVINTKFIYYYLLSSPHKII